MKKNIYAIVLSSILGLGSLSISPVSFANNYNLSDQMQSMSDAFDKEDAAINRARARRHKEKMADKKREQAYEDQKRELEILKMKLALERDKAKADMAKDFAKVDLAREKERIKYEGDVVKTELQERLIKTGGAVQEDLIKAAKGNAQSVQGAGVAIATTRLAEQTEANKDNSVETGSWWDSVTNWFNDIWTSLFGSNEKK